jgi:hypothetical protein
MGLMILGKWKYFRAVPLVHEPFEVEIATVKWKKYE